MNEPAIAFRLDRRSGVPPYRQLIDQVRHAIRLGRLVPGDQLPTVRDVVKQIAINPNTVHRAYRDLEQQGLTEGRPGSGTFVRSAIAAMPTEQVELQARLDDWLRTAKNAGFDDEAIAAMVASAVRSTNEGIHFEHST